MLLLCMHNTITNDQEDNHAYANKVRPLQLCNDFQQVKPYTCLTNLLFALKTECSDYIKVGFGSN